MKRYITLTVLGMILGTGVWFYENGNTKPSTPCRGGYQFHSWSLWKNAGRSDRTFGRDRMLMERHCLTCGHAQTKESD